MILMGQCFQRLITETKSGGIIAVFRHGAVESARTVTIKYLDPGKTYQVKTTEGIIIASLTGKNLEKQGFEVQLKDTYAGELFEIAAK